MIYLNGVNLVADSLSDLHEAARMFGISRSYYCPHRECYDVICSFKLKSIRKWIKRRSR